MAEASVAGLEESEVTEKNTTVVDSQQNSTLTFAECPAVQKK
ncbi:MAG: hypothetical protein ACLFM0_02930 [Spirochaetales bacterium]